MSLLSSVTALSPLSPLLTYTPCITCDWTQGWIQGWNNTDRWDGSSVRYAEGWAVGQDIGLEWEFQGTSLSLLLQPTPAYSLSISINDTLKRTLPDLATSTTVNLTDLSLGTHRVRAAFSSIDRGREISRDQRIRIMGVELGWEGVTVNSTTMDDSATTVSFSNGWNRMSSANPSTNVENATAAGVLQPHLQSFAGQSVSWTSYNGSSLRMDFVGNFLTLLTPLLPTLGTFTPVLDGVALPDVNLAKNLPNRTLDDSMTYNQVAWHRSGLAEGPHTFEMRNVGGEAEGTGGEMMVDGFRFGTVGQVPVSAPSSSLASASATSAAPSSSATSSDTSMPITNVSTSLGVFIAVGVGGLAVLGLTILLVFACVRRRRRAAESDPSKSFNSGGTMGGGGIRNMISAPTRPFSSANPKPFRDDPNGASFQALASPPNSGTFPRDGAPNPSSVNLLASASAATSTPSRSRLSQLPSWSKPAVATPPEMREPKPVLLSNPSMPRLSTAPTPRSTAALYPDTSRDPNQGGILLRPMSEAGEVGDFSSSPYDNAADENRTSSFSAFDPPQQRRPSLPFEGGDETRRTTVATSMGSMYPDEVRGDSVYSLGESYFGLEVEAERERRMTGVALGSPARDQVPAAAVQRPDARSKGYF